MGILSLPADTSLTPYPLAALPPVAKAAQDGYGMGRSYVILSLFVEIP